MSIAKAALEGVWGSIATVCGGADIGTPTSESWFNLVEVKHDKLVIATTGKHQLTIDQKYFVNALSYLVEHHHTQASACAIGSNKVYAEAGPLCRAARAPGSGQMNITYVLPILAKMGLVGIEKTRPSAAWVIA